MAQTDHSLPPPSARAADLHERMLAFMRETRPPGRGGVPVLRRDAGPHGHDVPPVIERLKEEARAQGLWNLFLPLGVRTHPAGVRAHRRAVGLEQ